MATPTEFHAAQARTAQGVLLLTRRQWDRMGSLDDWPKIAAQVTLLTAAGQLATATRGVEYALDALPEPVATVNPRAFAGVAPDGRPLDTLLYSSVVHAREKFAKVADQLESGRKWLGMLVHTAVADAGRSAAGAQITATPDAGWMRMVSPPCCQRCAVLAGKTFKWNAGFERHPKCDCTHVPIAKGNAPEGYTWYIGPEDVKDLTAAQRKAIADGGDFQQVINAHRAESRSANLMTTSEGTTRQGWASYVKREIAKQRGEIAKETAVSVGPRGFIDNYVVRRTAPRLTTEAIYRVSATREEAVRLLAKNGYIVGPLEDVARLAG